MKSLFIKLISFVFTIVSFSTLASADVDKSNPYAMIEEVAQVTFDRFASEEANIRENPEILKDIVREELMPHIFYQYAGLKVLGNYAKKASKDERREFVAAFREYLITSYAQVFTLYDNQRIVFKPEQDFSKKKIVMVGVDIIDEQRPPINIQFKVRKNSKTNEWQAFDLVAEGISLLDAKQKELRSILAQNGVPKVTEMLKEKSQRKIVFKDNADEVRAKIEAQSEPATEQ
ncbi:phospholipid-binding protein MlaC [Thalassotalea sp. HSM 43]|uniref:phospholipid-binding protein MlaC n=1 Tax=Thalassotalea sp. HSM 43 TaxID=2552945 RepID=UPI0010818132|nr:phospholipid-binding protein MlaC [Thalassotalea sp. HSM 43]QBY04787.1 phospholipid-binding protein MlaC [Thalassotalea sp. HSM 43]